MKTSLARKVHLNQHLFSSNALYLAAFRIAKIAKDCEIIKNKSNAYFVKVLKISLATLKRYIAKLNEIGFLKRTFNFKKNGEQTVNTITINTNFFDHVAGAQNELQNSIFSKEKNTNTQETYTSSFEASKSVTKDKITNSRRFESLLRDCFLKMKDKLQLSINHKEVDFIETSRGLKLIRINKKIIKKDSALQTYNFLRQLNFEKYLNFALEKLNESKSLKIDISQNELRIFEI